jgi:hypothetical protein
MVAEREGADSRGAAGPDKAEVSGSSPLRPTKVLLTRAFTSEIQSFVDASVEFNQASSEIQLVWTLR